MDHGVATRQREPGDDRPHDDRGAQAGARRAELGKAVDDCAGRGRQQREADHVKAPGVSGFGVRNHPPSKDERDEADRHVDEKDP